jgi:hypothetical protein
VPPEVRGQLRTLLGLLKDCSDLEPAVEEREGRFPRCYLLMNKHELEAERVVLEEKYHCVS